MQAPTTLERAFTLARSGDFTRLEDIRTALKRERHDQVEAHLSGKAIAAQLRGLLAAARGAKAA